MAGERGRKSNYIYASSKAGLTAFLSGLRNRVDREGVTVMTIKPGPVNTTMTAHMKIRKADVNKVAAAIVKAIDKRVDILYVPILSAYHVHRPPHSRAHLQEAEPVTRRS